MNEKMKATAALVVGELEDSLGLSQLPPHWNNTRIERVCRILNKSLV
jgi:hypothetical protein